MRRFVYLPILFLLFTSACQKGGTPATDSPQSSIDYYNRGVERQNKGDLKGAIVDYTAAAAINPRHAPAHFNLGHAYQSRKDYMGAIQEYGKAIEVNPDYAMAYANRGLCQLFEGDDADAQKDFDRSIEIDGNLKGALDGYVTKVKQERMGRR